MAEHSRTESDGIAVRRARAQDWPDVADLLAQLGRPDVRRDPSEEAAGRLVYEGYLRQQDRAAFVAESEGRVVGFINVEFRTRLNVEAPQAWIPDLVVDARLRGNGIGSRLIRHVEAIARGMGCWGMTLESANWRSDTHRFYEAHGWTSSSKSFYRPLSEIDWPPRPR